MRMLYQIICQCLVINFLFLIIRQCSNNINSIYIYSSVICSIILGIIILKSKSFSFKLPILVRSISFALVQFLTINILSNTTINNFFTSTLVGSLGGILLSKILIKEEVKKLMLFRLIFLFAFLFFINKESAQYTLIGFIVGILQSISFSTTNLIAKGNSSYISTIFLGFVWTGILLSLNNTDNFNLLSANNLSIIAIFTLFLLFSQFNFFYLLKYKSSEEFTYLMFLRFPIAIFIDFIFFEDIPNMPNIVFVLIIIVLNIYDNFTKKLHQVAGYSDP